MDDFVTKVLAEVQRLQNEMKDVDPDKPYDMDSFRCGQMIGYLSAVVLYLQENSVPRELIERLMKDVPPEFNQVFVENFRDLLA